MSGRCCPPQLLAPPANPTQGRSFCRAGADHQVRSAGGFGAVQVGGGLPVWDPGGAVAASGGGGRASVA